MGGQARPPARTPIHAAGRRRHYQFPAPFHGQKILCKTLVHGEEWGGLRPVPPSKYRNTNCRPLPSVTSALLDQRIDFDLLESIIISMRYRKFIFVGRINSPEAERLRYLPNVEAWQPRCFKPPVMGAEVRRLHYPRS